MILHKVPKGDPAPYVFIPKSDDCKVNRNRDVNRGCLLWDSFDVVNQTMRIFTNCVEVLDPLLLEMENAVVAGVGLTELKCYSL